VTEKKGFLDRAIDAISTRDEKAALEEAEASVKEAEQKAADRQKALADAMLAANAAEKRAAEAEERANKLEVELRKQKYEQMRQAFETRHKVLEENKFIASHTVEAGETLSHISLEYYGSAAKSHYMAIYEANKDVIGDNPNLIIEGTVLNIPELPEELKS
jgi:nucleoid-associated protein YgaU